MSPLRLLLTLTILLVFNFRLLGATSAPAAPASDAPLSDELFLAGRALFELLAPADVKAEYDFPTREQWNAQAARLQRVLTGDSLEEFAGLAADARTTLGALRSVPGFSDLADWLEQRLDAFEGAQQALRSPPRPKQPPSPQRPGTPPMRVEPVPHYDLWLARVRERPLPARADALMPRLRAAFAAEGVPPELAWVAEAESSLNPSARSPVGAKGLFQFMPATAKEMGLATSMPDERTHPEKSARAAARYLRQLHGRFGNWALALAAYNAGPGRVSRTLESRKARTFTAIADALPAETRMYVPKVCALITRRTGVPPERLPPPRG